MTMRPPAMIVQHRRDRLAAQVIEQHITDYASAAVERDLADMTIIGPGAGDALRRLVYGEDVLPPR